MEGRRIPEEYLELKGIVEEHGMVLDQAGRSLHPEADFVLWRMLYRDEASDRDVPITLDTTYAGFEDAEHVRKLVRERKEDLLKALKEQAAERNPNDAPPEDS